MATSWNRPLYDLCETRQDFAQSTAPLQYMLFPEKYYSTSKARNQLGLVAGNDVSNIRGNMVDLESDLYGITRASGSRGTCDKGMYHPACNMVQGQCQPSNLRYVDRETGAVRTIDTRLVHLPPMQFTAYREVPAPPPLVVPGCNPKRF